MDAQSSDAGGAVVTWVVTTPHRFTRAAELGWQPFGRRHAVAPDALATACGQKVATWRVFADLQFDPRHEESCLACADGADPAT